MQVLFVECGTGADQHGQNVTKAAARACRNAIEFNSIPSVSRLVPGGYDNLLLHIKIGVPHPASALSNPSIALEHSAHVWCSAKQHCCLIVQDKVDIAECAKVFPYGTAIFEVPLPPTAHTADQQRAKDLKDWLDTYRSWKAALLAGAALPSTS